MFDRRLGFYVSIALLPGNAFPAVLSFSDVIEDDDVVTRKDVVDEEEAKIVASIAYMSQHLEVVVVLRLNCADAGQQTDVRVVHCDRLNSSHRLTHLKQRVVGEHVHGTLDQIGKVFAAKVFASDEQRMSAVPDRSVSSKQLPHVQPPPTAVAFVAAGVLGPQPPCDGVHVVEDVVNGFDDEAQMLSASKTERRRRGRGGSH